MRCSPEFGGPSERAAVMVCEQTTRRVVAAEYPRMFESRLTNQDIVCHESLLVVDAPPNMTIDIPWSARIDGHVCTVLEAGYNLGAEAGLLADVSAAASGNLDLIFVAQGGIEPALLATYHGWIQMPPRGFIEHIGEASAAAAISSVAHLDICRVEPCFRVGVAEDLRLAQTCLAARTESVGSVAGASLGCDPRDGGFLRSCIQCGA